MTDFYRFPSMAKLSEWTWNNQIPYIAGEVQEVACAYTKMLYSTRNTHDGDVSDKSRWSVGMELMDVIHATETALRMEFSDEEVEKLRAAVEDKNRKRGYYDD